MHRTHTVAGQGRNRGHSRGLIALAVLVVLTLAGIAIPATAHPPQRFDAATEGTFQIMDRPGHSSVLFDVDEDGEGQERAAGAFDYAGTVIQNLARIPEGCGQDSSTGVDGSMRLTFTDGELELRRSSGEACFAFPFISVTERWVVAGGTGAYRGASGELVRELVGDVRTGETTGTLVGALHRPGD